MDLTTAKTFEESLHILTNTVASFSERAAQNDLEGRFPFENFADLRKINYPSLTVPKEYGGQGISLYELLRYQEVISKADGSTGLSIGWHMGIIQDLGETDRWKDSVLKSLFDDVKENGALINNCATEKQTGSPTRGGKPATTSKKEGRHWVINGRKTFTTMAPVLDYFNVTAVIKETEEIGCFLIPKSKAGVEIEETWDSVAMKSTGSHDLILNDVKVEEDALVEILEPGQKRASGWLLHIPACYLGIAQAAQDYAISFAKEYSPNSINGPIIELPNVKQKIGQIELELVRARHFLYSVAKKWDESNEDERSKMTPELGAVKVAVTNSAVTIVDLAMRVAGAHSLSEKTPLQRYYRDVRAGLHNPPMDDMILPLLAESAIENQTLEKNLSEQVIK
ncbi:acyl-CoA dehydrogenase family protein [Planomicrobium sp. CPCC 101079]|uniref:acyl-CoA dehydrogenase family protein n=1 Tax=Planomicrobium sp. CPCC 101079 TaxID=2599618 RepID=UPI0011B35EA9|nr:acyl-CoA dehydrogenase family protein [Planomicrobium sp. CPCC 101079]TWT05867.1 acyl-CoA dehydrogenase [Planomicrobium sp. CPCC 101079]